MKNPAFRFIEIRSHGNNLKNHSESPYKGMLETRLVSLSLYVLCGVPGRWLLHLSEDVPTYGRLHFPPVLAWQNKIALY